jgi:hypothetical protein
MFLLNEMVFSFNNAVRLAPGIARNMWKYTSVTLLSSWHGADKNTATTKTEYYTSPAGYFITRETPPLCSLCIRLRKPQRVCTMK